LFHFTKVLSIISFILVTNLVSYNTPFWKPLPFKEGVIYYIIDGNEIGIETLYIKDYGKTTIRFTSKESKIMFDQLYTEQITLTTPKWVYKIDLANNSAYKSTNILNLLNKEYSKLSKQDQKNIISNIKAYNFFLHDNINTQSKKTKHFILSHTCYDSLTFDGRLTCYFQNSDIYLKSQIDIFGFSSKTEAINIEIKKVDDSIFQLPKNLSIISDQESEEKNIIRAKQIISYLKNLTP